MTIRLVPVLLVLWASAAMAVLPPSAHQRMRDAAPIHLAMKIDTVQPPAAGRDTCHVSGPITALYRDRTKRLKLGQRITVSLACRRPGTRPQPGATIRVGMEQLRPGRTLRAYLNSQFGIAARGSGTKLTDE